MAQSKKLLADATLIAALIGVDIDDIKRSSIRLEVAINKMVVAEVVMRYTLLDEILGELIVRYFFRVEPGTLHFADQWKTQEFTIFVHHILDEMFLLKKSSVVHAIKDLPSEVNKVLQKVNALRNALAHSFFPENRREFKNSGKVLYRGTDIRTPAGLKLFLADVDVAYKYLHARAHGPELS